MTSQAFQDLNQDVHQNKNALTPNHPSTVSMVVQFYELLGVASEEVSGSISDPPVIQFLLQIGSSCLSRLGTTISLPGFPRKLRLERSHV